MEFLATHEARQTKIDHYLAQIAAEIRRGQVKHPRLVKVKDFLLRQVPADKAAKVQRSKMAWAAALKIELN